MKEKITQVIKKILDQKEYEYTLINVEVPKNKENGDYSSNIAMQLAKSLHKSPMIIAEDIISNIKEDFINDVKAVAPGFINFYIDNSYLIDNINNVIKLDKKYGSSNIGNGEKVNIEFVSANPTGTLHIGNARGGAYGDSLARIMKFSGYDVTKEYYLNDNGVQIVKLTNSIYSRYLTKCGIENEFPENGYPGQEIYDIAEILYDKYNNSLVGDDKSIIRTEGVNYLINNILKDLKEYRIEYDVVTSEKSIYERYPLDNIVNELDKKGYIYEKDGAKWFKASELLDTEDHVLVKADGNYTYLLPDIPYHLDKLSRGFTKLYDVLGTDHHGYIARLKSAIKAFDKDENALEIKLLQLVRLVKNGEVVSMHKRSGNVITLTDLIKEVGVNAARYYFSKYSLDTQMDFDIELAKKQSNENPVYYVCYAYARICSILDKKEIKNVAEYKYINDESAYNVLASVYKFPEVVENACKKELPHLITNYVYELASLFHTFYEKHRIITDNEKETNENLNLILAIKITLFNALNLIGVVPDERM